MQQREKQKFFYISWYSISFISLKSLRVSFLSVAIYLKKILFKKKKNVECNNERNKNIMYLIKQCIISFLSKIKHSLYIQFYISSSLKKTIILFNDYK